MPSKHCGFDLTINRLSKADMEATEAEWLLRRLDAGLYSLQTIDLILAWLCAEDTGKTPNSSMMEPNYRLDVNRSRIKFMLMSI